MHCSFFSLRTRATLIAFFVAVPITAVNAQIRPDNSLGSESSIVVPNQSIQGIPSDTPNGTLHDRIDGGAVRGNNLFHSFQEFNIGEGQGVYFSNPNSILNILTRVTGGNPSQILGTLGVLGNANLFFINPAGIVFGPNARLDVGGSFFATTADGILFENGFEFAASNPQAPPLLTINIPIGLNIRSDQPPAILSHQGNLSTPQDLTLNAGNLDLQGQLQAGGNLSLEAQETILIRDRIENPFIAEAGQQLSLTGTTVQILAQNHPESGLFSGGNLLFRSALPVQGSTQYWSGGNFQIEQLDGTLGSLLSPSPTQIRSGGDVRFDSYTGGSLQILAGGSVDLNQIIITDSNQSASVPEAVLLSNGITPVTLNPNTPTVDIRAGTIVNSSRGLTSTLNPSNRADITISNIIFTQPNGLIFLSNQDQPHSSLAGTITLGKIQTLIPPQLNFDSNFTPTVANGSTVIIDSRGEISLTNTIDVSAPFAINLSALPPDFDLTSNLGDFDADLLPSLIPAFRFLGKGGDVTLLAQGNITLNPGSTLESIGVFGGNFVLNTASNLLINNGLITSVTAGEGIGGDIELSAQSMSMTDFGVVLNFTIGLGSGGNINLKAVDTVEILNQGNATRIIEVNNPILSVLTSDFPLTGLATTTFGPGDGGNLTITTDTLSIRNNSQNITGIGTPTLPMSSGNGGNLTINASNRVEVIGNQTNRSIPFQLRTVFSPIIPRENIPIDSIIYTGITTGTTGTGEGGNLDINTRQFIVQDRASVGSTTSNAGKAGSFTVNVGESLELRGFAGLLSGSSASGDGGDLVINAPTAQVILEDGAGIATDTEQSGQAGNLTLNADQVILRSPSNLVASGILTSTDSDSSGSAGNLTLTTRELTLQDQARITASTSGSGAGGTVDITAERLTLRDQAQITVSSDGVGGAGNLNIRSPQIRLENLAALSAETSAGEFGNITLNSQDVQLRRNSQITTNATGESTGGSITINTARLIAIENSDITANAQQAAGGRITINADAVLGTRVRQQPTSASDITASSELGTQFSGTIDFNSEFDSSGFAVDFSQELVDPEALIAQNPCRNQDSQFIITGRGGLPSNPTQEIINPAVTVGLSDQISEVSETSINPNQRRQSAKKVTEQPISSLDIIPARGWVRTENGDVILVGYDPSGFQVQRSNLPSQTCNYSILGEQEK